MNKFIPLKNFSKLFIIALMILAISVTAQNRNGKPLTKEIIPVNNAELSIGQQTIAIIDVNLIDGYGGASVPNSCVIIKGNKIVEVGPMGKLSIPTGAQIVQGKGMSILPGLIDSHFHLDRIKDLPALFLYNGVTSLRDPGAWIESYAEERKSGKAMPRLYLTGPHIETFPPAYPYDAYVVRDNYEAVKQVNDLADEGATAVKIYFRVPIGMIKAVTEAAHLRGIPVTAHLEITEAMNAIEAGLDGVEHITSFGLSLTPKREAEKYRQSMLADNNFRKKGRYETWAGLEFNNSMTDSLIRFLLKKGTFISPTLGAFEYQIGTEKMDSIKLKGFENMKKLTSIFNKSGVKLVLGSHAMIAYAEKGWAYQREMEIWAESGITNAEIIHAATMRNAKYFKIDNKLGSIEKGKLADLVLIRGNPYEDIKVMRNIEKVMINGVFVR